MFYIFSFSQHPIKYDFIVVVVVALKSYIEILSVLLQSRIVASVFAYLSLYYFFLYICCFISRSFCCFFSLSIYGIHGRTFVVYVTDRRYAYVRAYDDDMLKTTQRDINLLLLGVLFLSISSHTCLVFSWYQSIVELS